MIKRLLLLVVASAFTLANLEESNPFQEAEKWINLINNDPESTWQAGFNFDTNLPASYSKSLLGTLEKNSNHTLPLAEPIVDIKTHAIPKSFDARKKWPHCRIGEIRDQGNCGSCWAVAAASVLSDRLCIVTKGKINIRLSQEELNSCCTECGKGCNGGYPEEAWKYIRKLGIVTGGNYGSHYGCQPYELKPCEHHIKGRRPSCPSLGALYTPKCKRRCTNKKYKKSFTYDHWKTVNAYTVKPSVTEIQKEIIKNGPVETGFVAYNDFIHYKSGIYKISRGAKPVAGHAAKIIGWGVHKGVKYWLIQNSWNSDWGEKGYFRVLRGTDECGIESRIVAGIPKV